MCVSSHALLSGLLLRVRAGGAPVTREELRTLLGAGCAREDIRRALAELGSGEELLASIADAEVVRRKP
jgi:chromosome segregation and condensation protein ScpB